MRQSRAFAQGTSVSVAKSRAEIEDMVTAAGATRFGSAFESQSAYIAFEMRGRVLRFEILFPSKNDRRFKEGTSGRVHKTTYALSPEESAKLWDAECRRLWRSLALNIKAKLTSIRDGISSFDVEFMPFVVLPNGRTVGEWLLPQLDAASQGVMPSNVPLLPLSPHA